MIILSHESSDMPSLAGGLSRTLNASKREERRTRVVSTEYKRITLCISPTDRFKLTYHCGAEAAVDRQSFTNIAMVVSSPFERRSSNS